MRDRKKQVGFSQRVRWEWLDQTANLVRAGNNKEAVKEYLDDLLHDKVSVGGQAKRGNRDKIITILTKIWLTVPSHLHDLRDEGLRLLSKVSKKNKIAVHWGMAMAVYPFWASVAVQVGRLIHLQGTVTIAQIQRRIREEYGERLTVSRAVRRVIRSYLDWQVLEKTDEKGVYQFGSQVEVHHVNLIAWLVEAYLQSQYRKSASLEEVLYNHAFFPFHFKEISPYQLGDKSQRLDLHLQGGDGEVVAIRSVSS